MKKQKAKGKVTALKPGNYKYRVQKIKIYECGCIEVIGKIDGKFIIR